MESQPEDLSDDAKLLAANRRLHETRKALRIEPGFVPKSSGYEPRTTCLRCTNPLPADRTGLCSDCDVVIAMELERRSSRDLSEAAEMRLKRSGLPADYAKGRRVMGDVPIDASRLVEACHALGKSIPGALFLGPAKTYKTSVAAAFLASKIREGFDGLFVSVLDLMTDITASYAKGSDTRARLIDACVNAPLLVLDDFGKEKASEHSAEVIFQILDGRFRRQLVSRWMIVTTQFAYEDLTGRFDAPRETVEAIEHRLSQLTELVTIGLKESR